MLKNARVPATLVACLSICACGGGGGKSSSPAPTAHPPLTVTSPNGGETWGTPGTARVTWLTGYPNLVLLDIDLSTDGGLTWQTLAEGVYDDGRHDVTLPDVEGTHMRIRVSKSDGDPSLRTTPADESGADFEIVRLTFVGHLAALTSNSGPCLAVADFDGDGALDAAVGGDEMKTHLYRGVGDGTFTEVAAGILDVSYAAMAWADIDGDGDLDLAISGYSYAREFPVTVIYRNDGGGVFTELPAPIIGVVYGALAWGDYDGDGRPDLAITGEEADYTTVVSRIYHNDGNGSFTDIHADLFPVAWGGLAWGDYDGDGDLDLALSGLNTVGSQRPLVQTTRIYRNDGGGTFTDIGADLPGVYASSLAWGDFDGDGALDLALTGQSASGAVTRIYRNNGGDWFGDIGAGLVGVSGGNLAWADFDGDGDLDLAVVGWTATGPDAGTTTVPDARVYRNDGVGVFKDVRTMLTGGYSGRLAWGDFDRDGKPDILLVDGGNDGGRTSPKAVMYRNISKP